MRGQEIQCPKDQAGTGHRVQGTGHRAQGTGHRVQSLTGKSVQSTGHRAWLESKRLWWSGRGFARPYAIAYSAYRVDRHGSSVRLGPDRDHIVSRVLVRLFWSAPEYHYCVHTCQTNPTKQGNEPESDLTTLKRAGVKTPYPCLDHFEMTSCWSSSFLRRQCNSPVVTWAVIAN